MQSHLGGHPRQRPFSTPSANRRRGPRQIHRPDAKGYACGLGVTFAMQEFGYRQVADKYRSNSHISPASPGRSNSGNGGVGGRQASGGLGHCRLGVSCVGAGASPIRRSRHSQDRRRDDRYGRRQRRRTRSPPATPARAMRRARRSADTFPAALDLRPGPASAPAAAPARRRARATSTTRSTCRAAAASTYTASCTISASATGIAEQHGDGRRAPAGVTDPTPGNNSATDTDTLDAERRSRASPRPTA